MVFRLIKSSDMSDDQLIANPELLPHIRILCGVIGIRNCVNGVVEHDESTFVLSTVKPSARVDAAHKQVGQIRHHALFKISTNNHLYIMLVRGTVRMTDTHGNPLPLRLTKRKIPKLGHVGVDDLIFGVRLEKCAQLTLILRKVLRVNGAHAVYPAAEGFYLVVVCSTLLPMHEKVKLNFRSVDMPIIIHHHGLGTASVHDGKHVQHPNRLLRQILTHHFILFIHIKSRKTPAEKFSLQQAKNTHQCGGK